MIQPDLANPQKLGVISGRQGPSFQNREAVVSQPIDITGVKTQQIKDASMPSGQGLDPFKILRRHRWHHHRRDARLQRQSQRRLWILQVVQVTVGVHQMN